ncbi:MAG: AmmeMemoRadiSam system radical SAM enzyme [Candidatus Fischerbacteria bacterium RBG_13_37_8]|uniref:AmmeMemoRadiSam system radical SAM enzyme n=1 Tax=Candidatus Fischerbacteria bacterium RBG_13_37_8 TaxID=1817863 RepID=A0A1F5VVN4_9BACT|nr:MAG: AmmeMemoRadiSam system radical SAM enzyme [Candidatus Fischerbacteria bacterium RBG_13_37_8]
MYYKKLDAKKVECELCPQECKVADLERGTCGVRENHGGTYYTLVHSRPCSIHVDPIEKKPLFHYLPGTQALSIATAGCNIECKFCQNWEISQFRPEQIKSVYLPPERLAQLAKNNYCPTISYTYTEPVVFYEYVYDTAVEAKKLQVGNVIISNGYIKEKPLVELLKHLSGVKIDFKAFTEKFYVEACRGHLQPVLDTLITLQKSGIWFELVVLIIPTLNDTEKEYRDMTKWIYKNLGGDVPVHFTRFHPMYKLLNLPSTPVTTLETSRKIAQEEGLNYVYIGNVPGHEGEHTYCPKCQKIVIKRIGFQILEMNLKNGKCKFCEQVIPGVWQ